MASKTEELKKIVDAFEQERDKLLDQLATIKGHADRMEWVIKVMLARVKQIEQEEELKKEADKRQEEALKIAREKGNIGVHPDSKKSDLIERRKEAISPTEEIEDSKNSKAKKKA